MSVMRKKWKPVQNFQWKILTTLHQLHVNKNWNYSIVYIDCFTLCKHACVHSAIVTCTCTCTCTCMYVQCIPYSTRGNCAKNWVCRFLLPVRSKCNCYTLIRHLDISIDHQFQVQVQFKFCNLWGATTEIFIIYSFIHLFVNAFIYGSMYTKLCYQCYNLCSLIAFNTT